MEIIQKLSMKYDTDEFSKYFRGRYFAERMHITCGHYWGALRIPEFCWRNFFLRVVIVRKSYLVTKDKKEKE